MSVTGAHQGGAGGTKGAVAPGGRGGQIFKGGKKKKSILSLL